MKCRAFKQVIQANITCQNQGHPQSAEVVHPQEMKPFDVAEVIDPQATEESSITIVKPKKIIYGNISLRIDITHTKKAPTQLQKPFATALEFHIWHE
jgi:hypothetical protein